MSEIHVSEILRVFCAIDDPDDPGHVNRCDAIEYEGRLWLVPYWLKALDGTHRKPERMIGLPPGAFQPSDASQEFDYVVSAPVPIAVIEGHALPEQSRYTVVERPNIRVSERSH